MQLHFTKMHGCGNDYIYINGFTQQIPQEDKPALVRRLSNRHFGIGGDGVIFINPSDLADFGMEMYNADGTRAEMCGNGIRCVGKYVYDRGMSEGLTAFTVESCGKVKILELACRDGRALTARVNMGLPVLEPAKIPVLPAEGFPKEEPILSQPIEAGGRQWRVTCVSMGNPHAVIFLAQEDIRKWHEMDLAGAGMPVGPEGSGPSPVAGAHSPAEKIPGPADGCGSRKAASPVAGAPSLWDLDLARLGPLFENHPRFPNRINTEFAEIVDRRHLRMRVWERGTGETLACGTGACAAAVAGVLNGLTDRSAEVELPGGTLFIEWEEESGDVYLTGPAEEVFEGIAEIEMNP